MKKFLYSSMALISKVILATFYFSLSILMGAVWLIFSPLFLVEALMKKYVHSNVKAAFKADVKLEFQ